MNNASAACVLSLLLASMPTTNAASLDDAAERYRPYLIEGIGQALTGSRNLRERQGSSFLRAKAPSERAVSTATA